ncbi:Methylated-DNA--protein-cysteine methyltransferase [Streptococcus sp. DD10]|uniref:methylated-DNA--[protein]-cysteine S-methyltransferase n=1 Tax=Streptococcus sp. DD10 TaxID=1777878 RepID=UPI00079C7B29|nr:methylated-DNA--[protein]-cysteine S-methyltransferase [Streptococcus sp. DD10]KXT77142.1 Methylated-DNA--protein-cysteine methyltransferase [Streptococcus sp. DD10]
MLYRSYYQSPIGRLSLIADDEALLGIWFVDQKYFEAGVTDPVCNQTTPLLDKLAGLLDIYFQTGNVDFRSISLKTRGTAFQRRVWDYLANIPSGETRNYGEIAQALQVSSAQAIGGAVGRNPWSILIPCHRVLGKNSQLTGYAGGVDRKIYLLKLEGVEIV